MFPLAILIFGGFRIRKGSAKSHF